MPLTATRDIVSAAAEDRIGAGSFNVIGLEHAEGIAAGAEAARAPVILQISENCVRYHGGLGAIGAGAVAIAEAADVPIAVHLDHATQPDLVHAAVELGFGSVMFDAAALAYDANVAATARIAERCHAAGAWVEGELGEIGGKAGVRAEGIRTDPAEAARYAAATGVDMLAVAVGSSHQMLTRDAVLDLDLIAAIRSAVAVPLVLHGSSGVGDSDLREAIRRGMTKINVATQLNKVFTAAVRDHLARDEMAVDPRRYLDRGRLALAGEVARLLVVLDAAGTAA